MIASRLAWPGIALVAVALAAAPSCSSGVAETTPVAAGGAGGAGGCPEGLREGHLFWNNNDANQRCGQDYDAMHGTTYGSVSLYVR